MSSSIISGDYSQASSSPQHESSQNRIEDEIHELRLRLDKRNILLDVVRKAYHRDVLVIREYLLQLKAGLSIEEILSRGGDKDLRHIPSIDIRHEGLHLFAPEECEMRLKPCFKCGGTLEVIHREGSRIANLTKSRDRLQAHLNDLEIELSKTKQEVETKSQLFIDLQENRDKEVSHLTNTINTLNSIVLEYENLKVVHENLQKENNALKIIEHEKKILDDSVSRIQESLLETKEKNEYLIQSIDDKSRLIAEIKQDLEHSCKLEEEYKKKYQDVKFNFDTIEKENTSLNEQVSQLQQNNAIINADNASLNIQLDEANLKSESLNEELLFLNEKLQTNTSDYEAFKQNSEQQLSMLKSELINLTQQLTITKDELETCKDQSQQKDKYITLSENQQAKIQDLLVIVEKFNNGFNSSIRAFYDHCLSQEDILSIENDPTKNTGFHNKSKNPEPFKVILDSLENKIQSSRIDWDTLLADESNRRKIHGNLVNRKERNLSSIDQLIKDIRKRHQLEIKRLESSHKKEIDSLTKQNEGQCLELNELYMKASNHSKMLSTKCHDLDQKLLKISDDLNYVRGQYDESKIRTNEYERQIIDLSHQREELKQIVVKTESQLEETNNKLIESESDLKFQVNMLQTMEQIVENLSQKMAKQTQDEQYRLDTNTSVSIQVAPPCKEFSQQVDFISCRSDFNDSVRNKRFRKKENEIEGGKSSSSEIGVDQVDINQYLYSFGNDR